jgi:hypothetical protein
MARDSVKKGVRDGSILKGTPSADEAALIVGALQGIAYQRRLDSDGFDPKPALRFLDATTNHRPGGRLFSQLSHAALSRTACSTTLVER